jgi:hypothetical protein
MVLKSKNQIENYELKAKVLRENGWDTWYHDDNWIRLEWYDNLKIRIDYAGVSTDQAYYEYSPEKVEDDNKILDNYRNTVEVLNNISKDDTTNPIEID